MSVFIGIVLLLCGCTLTPQQTTISLSDLYPALPEENHITIVEKENLETLIDHGTTILFLGFPDCPWCQAYLPVLEDVLSANDAKAFYYDIYADKSADKEFYDAIADLIDHKEPSIIAYDNDGKKVIYMPLVLFIADGEIIGYDNETSTEDSSVISPEEYWTDGKMNTLKERLSVSVMTIKQLQDEHDAKGCDNACSVPLDNDH